MAKQVIILRTNTGPGGDTNVNYLFWLAVPSGREIPIVGAVSQWTGASSLENTAIANGTVIEEFHSGQVPSGTTKNQVENMLSSQFNTRQTQVTAAPNPNSFFGVFLDSITGWSA